MHAGQPKHAFVVLTRWAWHGQERPRVLAGGGLARLSWATVMEANILTSLTLESPKTRMRANKIRRRKREGGNRREKLQTENIM